MCADDSVMHWFEQIQKGDSVAARAVWERYFPQLVREARQKLRGVPCRVSDEDDVATSVMKSSRAAQKERFPDLADRHDLWRLLLKMTTHKVVDLQEVGTERNRNRIQSSNQCLFETETGGGSCIRNGKLG